MRKILECILIFLIAAVITFVLLFLCYGLLGAPSNAFVILAIFVVPIVIGVLAVRRHTQDISDSEPISFEADQKILFDDSTLTIIKEEISCWNWQLIIGGLIFCTGCLNLLFSFFFAIVLLVLGLGLLSIGYTKYKEKQELQERELKRKIMAAVAEESPSEEKTDPAPTPKPAATQISRANTKCKTYKVAGVTHYVENIKSLGSENEDYSKSMRELIDEGMVDERIWKYEFYTRRALLQPEPDNPVDPNAIKVIVDCEHVGYIKSGSSSHVHKLLQNHAITGVVCTIGGGPYKCVCEEYDDEKDENVYVLEKDETNFFVHLEIYEK